MQRLLIIGCGDIACRTIPLIKNRYRIYALVRKDAQREWLRTQGVVPIVGDLDDRATLSRLAGLADVVLHFAPPPPTPKHKPAAAGAGMHPAATPEGPRRAANDTRTRHLLGALSRGAPPARLVYISTSGVYGDCKGARVNETQRLNPQSERAERRVDAERRLR